MEHYRSSVLQEDQVGVTPLKGYINRRKQSLKGNIWLDWKQSKLAHKIIREYRLGPYYVDGYVKETNTVYEFFGCFFHGCDDENCKYNANKCRFDNIPKLNDKTLDQVYRETKERVSLIYFRLYLKKLIKFFI